FPQLETASDARLMLQVFRQHLKAVSGKAYRIEECVPFRFRCRQSTSRCVLQYTLRVVAPSNGRRWEQWVTGVVSGAAGEADRWGTEQRTVEPMRYRTEPGAALRYTLRVRDRLTGKGQTRRCYLKVYRNERGAETFRLLQALTDKARAGESPYRVVRPIAYVPELRTLALEEARGAALQQILLRRDDWSAALRAVARAVAAFNQADLPLTECHSLADQLADVNRAASLVQWACQ